MLPLYRQELKKYFSSLFGLSSLLFFALTEGLFLWVFDDGLNLLDGGYATLDAFFLLSPWVFICFIPALCMRSLSEDRKSGTLELLRSFPISEEKIIYAKFLSVLSVVCICLLLSFLYAFSLSQLATPKGNLDWGALYGSYLGLFLCATAFTAIGLFAASCSTHTLSTLFITLFLNLLFFYGFEGLGSYRLFGSYDYALQQLGLYNHYETLGSGVFSLSDVLYFAAVSGLFISLAQLALKALRQTPKARATKPFFQRLFIVALVFIAAHTINLQWDLTQDHRFTLGKATESALEKVKAPLDVEILLRYDVPADFKRLKREAKRLVRAMRRKNPNVELIKTALSKVKKSEKAIAELKNLGVFPTQLQVDEGDSQLRKRIFPWVVIAYANEKIAISLLNDEKGVDPAEQLNHATQELEYKLTRSIRQLTERDKPQIAFYHGEGETEGAELFAAKKMLRAFYRVDDFGFRDTTAIRLQFDSLMRYKALVINNPKSRFSENSKYLIDQYIQHGGRVLWAVSAVAVNMEDLRSRGKTLAYVKDLNLTDLLFQYSVRINPVLVKDGQAAPIKVKAGNPGPFRYVLWPYFPLIFPADKHPIVRHINAVRFIFPSDLDVIATPDVEKTPLLWSSAETVIQGVPAYVNLSSAQHTQALHSDQSTGSHILAMALEGNFTSAYRYRVKPISELPFRARSKRNKMLVFASGAIFENETHGNSFFPVGYDTQTGQRYGNDALLLNSLAWLTDDSGLIDLRAKHLALRPLNREKIREERWRWQLTNLGIPLLLLLASGALLALYRRKKFGRQQL